MRWAAFTGEMGGVHRCDGRHSQVRWAAFTGTMGGIQAFTGEMGNAFEIEQWRGLEDLIFYVDFIFLGFGDGIVGRS